MGKLTAKQALFIKEYLIDLNATQAAIRAGYSEKTACAIGLENLGKPLIAAEIQIAMKERQERTGIDQDRIVNELWNIVTVDANEVIEYRRNCCRHCWGLNHRRQRTAGEMEDAQAAYAMQLQVESTKKPEDQKPVRPFDEQGGIGFNPRKLPNPNCPECFGDGVTEVFAKDTRHLSKAARSLYAGVKQTKDGFEIKMHDKQGFAQLLMRHQGMLVDKVEHTGKDGKPIEYARVERVLVDPKK